MQDVTLPRKPRREGRRTISDVQVGPGCLWVPDTRSPRPPEAHVSYARWGSGNFAVERPKGPSSIQGFLCIDVPDVVTLGFRLLAFLIEAGNVGLIPKIVAYL